METFVKEIKKNYARPYYCIGLLYQICDYLINYSVNKSNKNIDSSLKYVNNVITFIQLKYSENIKVAQIANACGLDRSYLTRLFKDATGYSFWKIPKSISSQIKNSALFAKFWYILITLLLYLFSLPNSFIF